MSKCPSCAQNLGLQCLSCHFRGNMRLYGPAFDDNNNKGPSLEKIEEIEERKELHKINVALRTGPCEPLFSKMDYDVVKRVIYGLPAVQKKIIYLRFWRCMAIADISRELRLLQRTVEKNLSLAQEKLKESCLKNTGFSRHTMNLKAAA